MNKYPRLISAEVCIFEMLKQLVDLHFLKEHIDQDLHIHLYTGLAPGEETFRRLQEPADEIRVDPAPTSKQKNL